MNSLQRLGRDGSRTPDFEDPYDARYETKWEATNIKPFKTQDEYLYAMVEDLAEWLNNLYTIDIIPENFYEKLENGSVLCQHANNMRRVAIEYRQMHGLNEKDMVINDNDIKFRVDAKEGSFNARDNISNFISWCRHSLNIKDVLLFESDDLVLRKNERSFILCLLEVARRGGKVGMPVPLLVQFEEDIEREINAGLLALNSQLSTQSEPDSEPSIEPASPTSSATTTDVDRELESGSDADHEMDSQRSDSPDLTSLNDTQSSAPAVPVRTRKVSRSRLPKPMHQHHMNQTLGRGSDGYASTDTPEQEQEPPPQVMLEYAVLISLHERVRELVNQCTCPNQFPMVREAEGKYRIGDQSTLIFVRILRSHVMVRVGGGWDTLEHYLDKHDPCRCKVHRSGNRSRTKSIGSDYRKSPKRRVSVEGPRLHSRNQSVESLDDVESRSVRSPSPRMKREDSNETIASQDSNQSTELHNGHGSPVKPKGSFNRSSPSRSSLQSEKRPSQLPRRLSQAGTGTEEFLKKRREELKLGNQGTPAHSAPTSPTRRRPLSSTQIDLNESNVQSDVYRRLALAGGRESGSATLGRRTRSASVNLTINQQNKEEISGNRSIPTSPTLRRKHRSGSLGATAARIENKRLADRRDNSVIMISRDTGGRHRLKGNSSDSNDVGSQDGSSLRSPTDSEKSATECVTRRLKERERTRSLSVDRSTARTKIPSFDRGSKLRTTIGGSGTNSKVATGSLSRATRPEGKSGQTVQSEISKTPKESHLQRSGSLRNSRTDRRLFNTPVRDQEGGFTRNSPRRRTTTGRDTRTPRQPIPAELNAENLAKYLQSYRDRVIPRETRSETRSGASSRASSRASSPGASRLRPRTPVPSHLKADPQTPIRKDSIEHPNPSRIPMPVQHKRLLSAEARAASARSHSLPDLIANMMDWCQRTINIDTDARSYTSADSMSPTPSLRTDQDSGYEDNAQKGSPLCPEDPYHLGRPSRPSSIAEGAEGLQLLDEAVGTSGIQH
ncbi:uncharacterized protein [Asterias amurensis]|uniref:uncharacterized protein n=1 Tax=Asterias amurensis TaxID=7602 RepID=UPI003AB7A664